MKAKEIDARRMPLIFGKKYTRVVLIMYQSNLRMLIPPGHTPDIWLEVGSFGGEFDVTPIFSAFC